MVANCFRAASRTSALLYIPTRTLLNQKLLLEVAVFPMSNIDRSENKYKNLYTPKSKIHLSAKRDHLIIKHLSHQKSRVNLN